MFIKGLDVACLVFHPHPPTTGAGSPLVHLQCRVTVGSGRIAQQEAPPAVPTVPCVCVLPVNVQWGVSDCNTPFLFGTITMLSTTICFC